MDSIIKHYKQLNTFNKIIQPSGGMLITDLTDNFLSSLIATDYTEANNTIFIILPNLAKAQLYYDMLSTILEPEDVLFYPSDEPLTSLLSLSSKTFKIERIFTIGELVEGNKKVVVLNQAAIQNKVLNKTNWLKAILNLKIGENYDLHELAERLVTYGYDRQYQVLKTGEFSIRGSIFDIYPIGAEKPFRIDFFDTEIETIKLFDPETQVSIGRTETVKVLPMNELFYSDKQKDEVVIKIEQYLDHNPLSESEKDKTNDDLDKLYNREDLENLKQYIPFFNETENCLFDFVSNRKIYFVDIDKMRINEQRVQEDLTSYVSTEKTALYAGIPFLIDLDDLLKYDHHEAKMIGTEMDKNPFRVYAREVISYQGNDHTFIKELKTTSEMTVVGFIQESRFLKFRTSLELEEIPFEINPKTIKPHQINIFYPSNLLSFTLYHSNITFMNESDIYDFKTHKRKIRYKSVLSETVKIGHINDLETGDYVVHYDYGIGEYKGIKTMELSGYKRDYIHIGYYGTDYLYIPVDQIDKILKYSSKEGHVPSLTKLGTNQWSNTKKRIKKKLNDLSDRLLQLYAEREESKGFKFLPNEKMHEDFAKDFEYVETPDQVKAIEAVTKDMESEKPMDRLICGDVGYGKTEVAMRAAFKAVFSGKQVAYLVPTTVLARQHYNAFKKRFDSYGITVEILSRFVSTKDQTALVKKIKQGLVDIVIGTHRLLSKDIVFKDLGLLVIDEEQRFGVEHKEKIKEMKTNIDCLSLSATPIPRTLQMSLVGIKDLSMIETPPLNRYPIQTYILERHPSIVKEAIEREIARGGQVYYLYNKVYDIDLISLKIKELVPEAKVAFAHGKLNRDELQDVISDFIDKRFDVLVSTTIIETGIDIPNTNTLIIHDADKFGLSQLYQIRGRVGRSDKIAYAYMMYDRKKVLSDDATKRLKTIKDFQELGSGFKIAMRDLSIRGAGDLLGEEQSGFIDSVGLEVYLKMLEEVIEEKRGIKKPVEAEEDPTILSERHIDQSYISNDEVRLEIHKRISTINNLNDANNLVIELEDRFGRVTDELKEYMYEKLFRKLSSQLGVEKTLKSKIDLTIILSIDASKQVNGEKLFMAIEKTDNKIKLSYLHERVHITLVFDGTKKHYLIQMIEYLSLVLED